jgi:hypothetical protein
MSAFPKVLEKVPNARLIVAGANHHTKAGYWESIRDAQPAHLPIEFRGYVPEEAIPELFQTTSVLVLPYDSATGSSGPAHQACEYGVPIVCADIDDFKEMVTRENMAVRFYRKGDPDDLSEQFISILKSPELQRQMAEHNFAAGVEMTMTSVVKNYLRWFGLHKCKSEIRKGAMVSRMPGVSTPSLGANRSLAYSGLRTLGSHIGAGGLQGEIGECPEEARVDIDHGRDRLAGSFENSKSHYGNNELDQTGRIAGMSV